MTGTGLGEPTENEPITVRGLQLFLIGVLGFGGLLLCVSMVPAYVFPHGTVRRVVERRRPDLITAGVTMLAGVALGFLAVYVPS